MAQRPSPPPHGFVATGPGFYVWEETRGEAYRAARDLGGEPEAVRVEAAGGPRGPGPLRRRER